MTAYLLVSLLIWSCATAQPSLGPQSTKSNLTWSSPQGPRTNASSFNKKFEPGKAGAESGPSKPILVYKQPSREELDVKPAPVRNLSAVVRDRSLEADKNGKQGKGAAWSLSPAGYFAIVAVAGLALLAIMLLFIYSQQQNEVVRAEDSNSHVSEAKQLLKNRLYVVKRYLPYHFEAGLPCPEKLNASSSSSSLTGSPKNAASTSKPSASSPKQAGQQPHKAAK